MILRPENPEDISSIYLLNKIFVSVSDLYICKRNIKKDMTYLYKGLCVYIFLFYW